MVNRSSTGKQVTNPGKKKVRDVMEEYKLANLKVVPAIKLQVINKKLLSHLARQDVENLRGE
tara:strand:- start:1467 stop:1652 length:186 start_codon:yes stop_codon:yes gene_type:complete